MTLDSLVDRFTYDESVAQFFGIIRGKCITGLPINPTTVHSMIVSKPLANLPNETIDT